MLQLAFDFLFGKKAPLPREDSTRAAQPRENSFLWKHGIMVHLVRPARAKRYLLRLQADGSARLAIPRRGSRAEALRFLERSEAWLRDRRRQWLAQTPARRPWQDGAKFLFRGVEVTLSVQNAAESVTLSFADQVVPGVGCADDYRRVVHARLRELAERELPPRTWELAQEHRITIQRVTVRAQKTRWGSCSARGAISLNWRLIQAPPLVVDYLIIHELMHRRQMNHSAHYWKLVAEAYPRYREAEAWLKKTRLEGLI